MKLIVGLGNPGKEYDNTRHNVGFRMLDSITKSINVELNKKKFDGQYGEAVINGEKVLFLKPLRYMNLSGTVVREFVKFFKIAVDDILIISDDLDTPVGSIKIKFKGSSGGHNGLKDIENNLGTNVYKRIKIGISNNKMIDTKDYVLGHFSTDENKVLKEIEEKMVLIFNDYMNISFDRLMSKYNK